MCAYYCALPDTGALRIRRGGEHANRAGNLLQSVSRRGLTEQKVEAKEGNTRVGEARAEGMLASIARRNGKR